MKKLPPEFYQRTNVLAIAEELLGKLLVTSFDGELTSGRIVETEAYNGIIDRASHAYGGRNTQRTNVMFGAGGTAYVFLCYGIHHLFNVVTNTAGVPHAVLVRGIEPVQGKEIMIERMNKEKFDASVGRGPGNVSRALGIYKQHTGFSLNDDTIWIADDGFRYPSSDIIKSPRIGVDYAGEDALLDYRFYVKDNPFVSGKKIGGKKKPVDEG
ncbi:MAG: DNA-3-methyladenine glycosylase [Williamsia sp.]|nr:DNA-3-methyladenine glycosylase [Williamsia sp.]